MFNFISKYFKDNQIRDINGNPMSMAQMDFQMNYKPDIIDKLMDFDKYGNTAIDRVYLREAAAVEIFNLREEIKRLKKLTDAKND